MKYCLLIVLFPLFAKSQLCRYKERIFEVIDKTPNVIYGNAPAITAFYLSEATTTNQDLKLDIFKPTIDTATKRALIIFAHSGGFINGTKDNEDMQALCDSFAHRGYVTASLDYRLNFNLLSSSSSERAVWRGIQDGSAAVRFFKHNAALYKIDTTKIFIWGSSAGAFLALGLAYLDDAERPASTFSAFLQPNLGCKDCTGNAYPNTSLVTGVISCWGATKDTAWIQNNNNIPVQLFHGTGDGTVPITEGYPFGLPTITYVRGSQQINEQLNRTSIYHEYYPVAAVGHEYWGTSNGTFIAGGPTAYYADIINKAKLFMLGRMSWPVSCTPLPITLSSFTGNINDEKAYLYCTTATENNTKEIVFEKSRDGIIFTPISFLAPKGINGAGANYQTVDNNFVPGINYYRIKIVDLDGTINYSSIVKLQSAEKEITILRLSPNPVHNILNIQLQSGKTQQVQLIISDVTGKLCMTKDIYLREGMNNSSVPLFNLSRGIYFIHYKNAQGTDMAITKMVKD